MLNSFRIRPNNFVTIDSYKSNRIRHRLARLIVRLFHA